MGSGSFHDTDVDSFTSEDFRFTTKGDVLYAIGLSWPKNGEAVIHALAATTGSSSVETVGLIGSEGKLTFEQRSDGLHVQLPEPSRKYAYALRVTFNRSSR
jgi:alpha-L-fucosidase